MTHLLPEFGRSLPENIQLDGELVALDETGRPDFHRLSARMLHGRTGIALTLFVFDVLAVEGLLTTMQPYSERRELLEELALESGTCGSSRPSRTARRCSPQCAGAGSRASWRSASAIRTGRASGNG
jgi:ATP-dependent DNA ligase